MKRIFVFFIILIFSCEDKNFIPSDTAKVNTEKCLLQLESYYENGIKSDKYYKKFFYNEERYLIKEIDVDADCPAERCYSTFEYDKLGNLVKENFFRDKKLSFSGEYTYDSRNNKIKKTLLFIYNSQEVLNTFNFEYNSLNKVIVEKYFENGILQRTCNYSYDSNGYQIEINCNSSNSSTKHTFEYDSNKNLLKETALFNNDFQNVTNYKFDNRNREIEKKTVNNKNGIMFESQTSYSDLDNSSISRMITYENGKPIKQTNKTFFDEKNRVIKFQVFNSENVLDQEVNNKYNSEGYITFYEYFSSSANSKRATEYKYLCN